MVIGAGKASAAMARAVEDHWTGPLSGLVATRCGYAVPCARIGVAGAAHPVPDAAGSEAARRMTDLVQGLAADDLVLCLISGGGSALLPLPLDGVTLADKPAVNRALLASGASITEPPPPRHPHHRKRRRPRRAARTPCAVTATPSSSPPSDRPAPRRRRCAPCSSPGPTSSG
ncbi:DUF4147 domain-containing protein [Azospirillum agricola]|uniref:DUF4147 domain-containing protein n=1 Tax=Azospirillum agricola TaxID=1720247 RepID=UPI0037BE61B8